MGGRLKPASLPLWIVASIWGKARDLENDRGYRGFEEWRGKPAVTTKAIPQTRRYNESDTERARLKRVMVSGLGRRGFRRRWGRRWRGRGPLGGEGRRRVGRGGDTSG